MTRSGRFATFALSVLLLLGFSVTAGAAPASATITTLCTGYTGCAHAGMWNDGYSAANKTMYWRMYSGHNCTNYAAYRMVRAGLANVRPWTGSGNATAWGTTMSAITNGTPAVGAVAWWKAGVKPAGSAGHVAFVERVVSADEIIVSQDSWNGDFSWTRIIRSGGGWPSGFVHFRDVALRNTTLPTISGAAKVGTSLTATPGTWSEAGTSFSYQWMQDGTPIPGATGSTLTPQPAQQGKAITVRVTAVKLGFPNTPATSLSTTAVTSGVLSSTGRPAVTGVPQVGETLAVTTGSWNPTPESLRYQWQADGVPIHGATLGTLAVGAELVGKALSVVVTAVRTGFPPVTTTSAPTAAVVRAVPVIRVATTRGRHRIGVSATVTAVGVRPVTGVLQVRSRGRTLSQVALRNGVASVTLTRLRSGPRTFQFRYVMTSRVLGGQVQRRLVIG